MAERKIPGQYAEHGWYGNNWTIPHQEKQVIAESEPDTESLHDPRAQYRGQQAEHLFYEEFGLAPEDQSYGSWIDYENHTVSCGKFNPSELPLHQQREFRGDGK